MLEFRMIVRIARVLLGMTQIELAETLGVSTPTVCSWEHGRSFPFRRTREKFEALCHTRDIGFAMTGMPVPMEKYVHARLAPIVDDQQAAFEFNAPPVLNSKNFQEVA